MSLSPSQRPQLERHVSTPSSLSAMGINSLSLSPNSSPERPSGRSQRSTSVSGNSKKDLPPIFWYMEAGEWEKASARARRHPRDAKTWATLKTKDTMGTPPTSSSIGTKRLALHHACFKLRSAGSVPPPPLLPPLQRSALYNQEESARGSVQFEEVDPFIQICNFILQLIQLYPDAAGVRESRHGCLPLHLASFASCASRAMKPSTTTEGDSIASPSGPSRPLAISKRSASDTTTATLMSAMHAEEGFNGGFSLNRTSVSASSDNLQINPRREQMAVKVINALLDAYPKAIRVDSEGGRLPLHTACAGRATPRVISTLLSAYPSAARHRNKDGFLPLHLSAHWGVSHPNVAINLLKAYPDATVGRNRWERTPLEEALCMAGENGRPHQSALVRALRKHPSFWTRSDCMSAFFPRAQAKVSMAVDVDESLPSTEEDEVHMLPKDRELFDDSYDDEEFGQEVAFVTKDKASKAEDVDLTLPLETLIHNRKWDAVVQKIQMDPLEAEKELNVMTRGGFRSNTGFFPLHYACERNPPAAVCQALIEACPMAVLTRCMPGGCLPLHIACTWHCSPSVVRVLLSADHGGAVVKDELGNMALHSACFSGADVSIIDDLVSMDPKSVLTRNHQGSRPIDICKRLRHDNREAVCHVLMVKQEALVRHRKSMSSSSGTWSAVADEAQEWIKGTGMADKAGNKDEHVEIGSENEKEELLWI